MLNKHAILRAKERYGLDLTDLDLGVIAASVAAGKGVLVRRDTDRKPPREEFIVEFRGGAVRVVYSPVTRTIITFLPRAGGHPRVAAMRAKTKMRSKFDKAERRAIRAGAMIDG